MNASFASAALAIASVVLYQSFLKSIPGTINPFVALTTFYVTALICTLVVIKFAPIDAPQWSLSGISLPAIGAGMAIVGIELGYLLMYRSGWHLSAAPLFVMGGAAIILTPVGLLIFRQPWAMKHGIGIALVMYGLYLLSPQEA